MPFAQCVKLKIIDAWEEEEDGTLTLPRELLGQVSGHFESIFKQRGVEVEQEFELSKYSGRAVAKMIEVIRHTEQDFDVVPYLGLMVDIARLRKDYDIYSLQAWITFWLDRNDADDESGRKKFTQVDVGHYLYVAESLCDESWMHRAEMLARTRLTPAFEEEWEHDEFLCEEKDRIGNQGEL